MLFNDDVEFYSKTIEKMLSIENESREILVGPTCDTEGKLSYGGVIKKSRFRPNFDIIDGTSQRAKSCDTFNANCVLIPWKIFKNLGNMDSAYSHSLGDFDYGFKASKKGIPIWVCDFFVGQCSDITVYMLMMIFADYINILPEKLDKKRFQRLILTMLLVFSILPSILQIHVMNDSGKGVLNMLLIYLIGRYIRKYDLEIKDGFKSIVLAVLLLGIEFVLK